MKAGKLSGKEAESLLSELEAKLDEIEEACLVVLVEIFNQAESTIEERDLKNNDSIPSGEICQTS